MHASGRARRPRAGALRLRCAAPRLGVSRARPASGATARAAAAPGASPTSPSTRQLRAARVDRRRSRRREPQAARPGRAAAARTRTAQSVAVALFGAGGEPKRARRSASTRRGGGPAADYLDLGHRHRHAARLVAGLALSGGRAASRTRRRTSLRARGSDVIDTQTGSGHARSPRGRSTARASLPTAATGSCSARRPVAVARRRRSTCTSPRPDGAGLRRLTSDGRSLNPVWGPRYIAYDRERLRRLRARLSDLAARARRRQDRRSANVPAVRSSSRARAARLLRRRQPAARRVRGPGHERSVDGARLLRRAAHAVTVHGRAGRWAPGSRATARTLLIDENAFEGPPSSGRVATIPFAGGRRRSSSRTARRPAGTTDRGASAAGPRPACRPVDRGRERSGDSIGTPPATATARPALAGRLAQRAAGHAALTTQRDQGPTTWPRSR